MKNNKQIVLIFVSIHFLFMIISLWSLIKLHSFFSVNSYVESLLLLSSFSFLFSRYISGKILTKYYDNGYNYSEKRFCYDNLIVNISSKIIRPLSQNVSIALFILLIYKHLPVEHIGLFANLIYESYQTINKNNATKLIIFFPILIVCLLSIYDFIKYEQFKNIKRYLDIFFLPLKIIAIMVFFIHIDQGIRDQTIYYKINNEIIKILKVDAQKIKPTLINQEENKILINKAIDLYVDYILDDLEKTHVEEDETKAITNCFVDFNKINRVLNRLKRIPEYFGKIELQVYEDIRNNVRFSNDTNEYFSESRKKFTGVGFEVQEIYKGTKKGKKSSSDQDEYFSQTKKKFDDKNRESIETYSPPINCENSTLSEKLSKQPKSFWENFINIMTEERSIRTTSINEKGEKIEILKDIIKGMILQYIPIGDLSNYLPLHIIVSTYSIEYIKDNIGQEIAKGFMLLMGNDNLNRKNLYSIKRNFIKNNSESYAMANKLIKKNRDIFNYYYQELNTNLSENILNQIPKSNHKSRYLGSLKQKIAKNEKLIDECRNYKKDMEKRLDSAENLLDYSEKLLDIENSPEYLKQFNKIFTKDILLAIFETESSNSKILSEYSSTLDPTERDFFKSLQNILIELKKRKYIEHSNNTSQIFKGIRKFAFSNIDKIKKGIEKIEKIIEKELIEIRLTNMVLDSPNLLNSHHFLKNKFSPGGIFVGKQLKINNFDIDQIETIYNSPGNFNAMISSKNQKNLFIENINPKLYLSALKFVFAHEKNLVLIAAFFDSKKNKQYAFNKVFLSDEEFMQDLKNADEFIFRILKSNNITPNEEKRFKKSISNYSKSPQKPKRTVDLSRVYDNNYYSTLENDKLIISPQFTFSVVSKTNNINKRYIELNTISEDFNTSHDWIIKNNYYFKNLNDFAIYQSILKGVNKSKVDILDLVLYYHDFVSTNIDKSQSAN